MRTLAAFMFAIALIASSRAEPATAALSSAVLGDVSVQAKTNAPLPLSLAFIDETGAPRTLGEALGGRPSLLLFQDYTCRVVVVGLDPKDGVAGARAMRSSHIEAGSAAGVAAIMLTGNDAAIHAVTAAVGYNYVYDPEHDQFAHPAAAYVITPAGRIARVLSGLGLDGNDLRLALVDAGEGRIGTFIDHIRLLCYGFDPAQGIYTASIERWLMALAAATVIALAAWLIFLMRSSRSPPPQTRST